MSEANQQVIKETRVTSRVQNLTDTASFNAFVALKLSNGQEVSTQLTFRHGIDEDAFVEDFRKWYRILDRIAQDGGDTPYAFFHNGTKPASPAAPSSPEQPDKPTNGQKRNWKDPLPPAEVPAELADTNEDVYAAEFDLFKVLPQPDDKATVEFWKDGMDYPVGAKINKWKSETVKQTLAKLAEDIDPSKAAEHRIAGTVYWVLGNEYTITKGPMAGQKSRYKNLVLVLPAF